MMGCTSQGKELGVNEPRSREVSKVDTATRGRGFLSGVGNSGRTKARNLWCHCEVIICRLCTAETGRLARCPALTTHLRFHTSLGVDY
ncbi:hypothetical protein RRG08_035901 [Elysia crispata]|uniref:Uncharacterized protein n=1 Tax=Elysia crispata TaxID=231223 RepID=A0AAE1A2N5_9GAST|nr:hypothetical protein RRG08_035901 [Elysia crispata]